MKTRTKLRFQDLPKDYAALCRLFLPRPIHDAVDYANVVEVTDAMVLWHEDFTRDQADYFDLLCSLIEEYDSKNVKWPKVTGVDVLKHLLGEQRLAGVHGLAPRCIVGESRHGIKSAPATNRQNPLCGGGFLEIPAQRTGQQW